MSDNFILGAYWKRRPKTLGDYIANIKVFFLALQEVDPAFSQFFYRSRLLPGYQASLLPGLSNFQDLILQDRDFYPREFTNPDADGKPTLQSIPATGFITSFWNGKAAIKGGLEIMISAGASSPSDRLTSSVVIEFPYTQYSDYWLNYDLLRKLMLATVKAWSPGWATVNSSAFRKVMGSQVGCAAIGWMTYFADPNIASLLPSGIPHELVPQRGVIIQTTPEQLSAQNPQHIQTARRIEEALKGKLCGTALYQSK